VLLGEKSRKNASFFDFDEFGFVHWTLKRLFIKCIAALFKIYIFTLGEDAKPSSSNSTAVWKSDGFVVTYVSDP